MVGGYSIEAARVVAVRLGECAAGEAELRAELAGERASLGEVRAELEEWKQRCGMLEGRVSGLEGELEEECSKHRIEVQELEGARAELGAAKEHTIALKAMLESGALEERLGFEIEKLQQSESSSSGKSKQVADDESSPLNKQD